MRALWEDFSGHGMAAAWRVAEDKHGETEPEPAQSGATSRNPSRVSSSGVMPIS